MFSRKHSQFLYLIPQVLHFALSFAYLHLIIFHIYVNLPRLLTRFDNELAIDFALSINCYL